MPNKKYKPQYDKLFYFTWIFTAAIMLLLTVFCAFDAPLTLFVVIPTDLFVFYFYLSSICAYAELREKSIFIKFGFFIKREIPYDSIRKLEKTRKFYSDSMLSIKTAMEHVNIRYNKFDICSVSLSDSDEFIQHIRKIVKHS